MLYHSHGPLKMIQKMLIKKLYLFRNLTVEPTQGLRSWLIHEYDDVEDSYLEFKDEVFLYLLTVMVIIIDLY
jgi:hypothetical protein